jgi:serine/threonine protein kinase
LGLGSVKIESNENYKFPGAFKHPEMLSDTSLETEEENLEGDEQTQFLVFIRKMLQWRPEDRASASELLKDPWLRKMCSEPTESKGDSS